MRLIRRIRNHKESGQRGQAMVEFAVIGIIFAAVIFGMIDVGRAVWNYNTLAQATREGARFAVVHGARCDSEASCEVAAETDIDGVVRENAAGLNDSQVTVAVEWTCRISAGTCNDVWDHVTVTSEYDYQPMGFLTGLLSVPAVTMTSTSTMEIHY